MGGEAPKNQDTVKGENKSSRPQAWRKFFASHTENTPHSRRSSSATRTETPHLLRRSLKRFMGDDFYSKFSTHLQTARSHLPPINFITVHYTYFITTCLITSLIFWGSSHPSKSISYTDSLFLVISAMTEAGLNTVDLSTMTTFQQVLLWLLIICGSAVFVSISTILTRKRYFELRFKHVVEMQKASRRTYRLSLAMSRRTSTSRGRENDGDDRSIFERIRSASRDVGSSSGKTKKIAWNLPVLSTSLSTSRNDAAPRTATSERISPLATPTVDHITFAPDPETVKPKQAERNINGESSSASTLNEQTGESSNFKRRGKDGPSNEEEDDDAQKLQHWEYPSYLNKYTTGHNAQFHGLTKAEREHLGGVEYQAISLLAWIVPIYWILWQFLGGLGLALYFGYNKASVAEENGINPWWLGIFNAISAFNNSGMSLLDANMIPFRTSVYTLITMGLLILAGNTAYPIFLRLIIRTLLKLLTYFSPSSPHIPTLTFILRYPRRVYTNLFPRTQTLWLLFMILTLNAIDWAAFELLNINNPSVASIPGHFRILDGLFQALAVRCGGFYIISMTELRIGLQLLYVIMMYISAYPVIITMRHSNVYEEQSLGIYPSHHPESDSPSSDSKQPPSLHPSQSRAFISLQLRSQLSHDLWWLVLATLLITCIEVSHFEADPVTYSVFNIIFEVVSAYGCVGISTGLPGKNYSFSGGWHTASKLVLCAVMLRGRHRGLPVGLDRAVRLGGLGEGVVERGRGKGREGEREGEREKVGV
ncbi:cation transporter protein [Rutstroemia sp. NJR-2017a BBW]|nr:cation transporter protein [Rutstroemia sp. NJR-2017a BBW]